MQFLQAEFRLCQGHKNNRRASYRAIRFDPVTVRIEILDRVERLPQRCPGPLKITALMQLLICPFIFWSRSWPPRNDSSSKCTNAMTG